MLKAVRFDEEFHKDLIDFIDNYRDKKNKPNHSEAIRFLMQQGLDKQQAPTPQLDIESIKKEIFTQIMSQINIPQPAPVQAHAVTMVNLPADPAPIRDDTMMGIRHSEEYQKQISKPVVSTNPLLANLLGNSQR